VLTNSYIHHHLSEVSSTNRWANEWFRQFGITQPVLFTTDHQLEGKGQRNRPWYSEPGKDLSMSLALPVGQNWTPAILNMKIALSVRNALLAIRPKKISRDDIYIKWPNDIYLLHDGLPHKVAGILVENVWKGAQWHIAIVGVGVNVLSQMQKTPFQAISIKDAWGLSLQPPLLGEAIATSILNALSMPKDQALALYNEALLGKGQRRTFVIDGQSWQGTLVEINEEGNALFDWINSDHLREPPNDWLPSSQVTWCWTPPND